jgi:actin cytoskeleton-regulatory complex protein PAN1
LLICCRQSKNTRAVASEPSRQNGTTANGDLPTHPAAQQTTDSSSSLTAGQSHQDRIASAKEKALKRVQERLAAAGIKTGDAGESLQQRQERERKEREDRVRKAEAEDAKREQERQQRLAMEGGTSPVSSKAVGKKPPPPPSRKARQDSTDLADKKAAEAAAKARAEEDAARELRVEQEAQEAQRKQLEYIYPSF